MNRREHSIISPALRLWPGVVIAILLVLARYVVPLVAPYAELFSLPLTLISVAGGLLCGIAIVVWWMFFSRAPWLERVGAIALMALALFATSRLVHESIAGGMMGMMLYFYAIPLLTVALVAWAAATRRLPDSARRVSLVAAVLLACTPWTLVRTAGLIGPGSEFHWRWTETPEDRLLASDDDDPVVPPASTMSPAIAKEPPAPETAKQPVAPDRSAPPVSAAAIESAARVGTAPPAEWPGFRGPARDSVVHGVRIDEDWSHVPPVEMWRRPIGPGWSSFAVRGDLFYTQEQRGDDEIVAAYSVTTGQPVWRHRDAVRFWESNGGAGPRATPTLDHDRVYAFGATGILNALDAGSGKVVWSRNVASDTGREVPDWGFSSSPLVVGDVVIVAASGTLAGYDAASGNLRWMGPRRWRATARRTGPRSTASTRLCCSAAPGAISVAPADGAVLWEHQWAAGAIVQPALTADGDILMNAIAATGGAGMRRVAVAHGAGGWRSRSAGRRTG